MPSAATAHDTQKDLIDLSDRESISSSESIYNGSAEERFVILRRLRSDIRTTFAKYRSQFDKLKGFSDEEIEDDDDKFELAAEAHAERRSLIRAIILWVNECHELLDPKIDASTIELSALVLRRVVKKLHKYPQRIPDDLGIHQKLILPTVDDMMAPLRRLHASAKSAPSSPRARTRKKKKPSGQGAFQYANFPPLPSCTVEQSDQLPPPIETNPSAAIFSTGTKEDVEEVEVSSGLNKKNSEVGHRLSYVTNIPLHNRFQLLQGEGVQKGEEEGEGEEEEGEEEEEIIPPSDAVLANGRGLPPQGKSNAAVPNQPPQGDRDTIQSTHPSSYDNARPIVGAIRTVVGKVDAMFQRQQRQQRQQLVACSLDNAESTSRLKQIASQQARDARPSSKFSRGQPMDFKNFMMRFEIAVSSPGMDARSKMIEMTHWFASPAVEVIDAFVVWDDPEQAYASLCAELNRMFGAEGDSAIPLIRQLTAGSGLEEYDHDAHILFYTKLIQAESTARAFNRMDQLDRRDTLVELVENRLKHLVRDFWQKDVALRRNQGRSITYADFKQMLSDWIEILSSRRPHVRPEVIQQQPQVVVNSTRASTTTAVSSLSEQSTIRCNICRLTHSTEDCSDLLSLSIEERSSRLKQFRLCFHCLQPGHVHRVCPAPPGCRVCPAVHHTIFHGRQTGVRGAVSEEDHRSLNQEEEEEQQQQPLIPGV